MKNLILATLAILTVSAIGFFLIKQRVTPEAPTVATSTVEQYSSADYGISFSYPKTYILTEVDAPGSGMRKHHSIVLMQKADLPLPEAGEGPPSITIDVYQNNLDKQTTEGWIKNTSTSNWKQSEGTLASTTVGGLPALSYRWSGLYEGTTIVAAQPSWVYALTVTYLEMGAPIVQDFVVVRDSVRITPTTAMSEADAVNAVIAVHPELAAYKTTSLPPSSVETMRGSDGWDVGFIQRGSGVPGILSALCYRVTDNKEVSLIGTYKRSDKVVENIALDTCSPTIAASVTPPPQSTLLPYGHVTLALGELAIFRDISIRPLTIEEDSRCPSDVQCIWAGRVRLKVEVVSGASKSESILMLGEPLTTKAVTITLSDVAPGKNSKTKTTNAAYRFTLSVTKNTGGGTTPKEGKCFVGGCSGQLCTDRTDVVSTCEYREAYACYQSAVCERQQDGACGWTNTPELATCLGGK